MNRSKLLSALIAASLLTTGAMAQAPAGPKPTPPKPKVTTPAVSATATTDTTHKKPVMTGKKKKGKKPVKPDSTKTKKPN
jgi:hypothetical protein